MAIVKMKHLRLIAMAEDREKLLRLLQHIGCVEVDEASLAQEEKTLSEQDQALFSQLKDKLTRLDSEGLTEAREEQNQAERALAVLKRSAPVKGNFLAPKPEVQEKMLFDEPSARTARDCVAEINGMDARLTAIHAEEVKLTAQRSALAPWLSLDLPLETASTAQVTIQLGTLPASVPMEQAQGELQQVADLAQLSQVSADTDMRYCVFVCHNSQAQQGMDTLKELGWSRANLREWTGTAAENDARIASELSALADEREEISKKLSGMGDTRSAVQQLADLAGVTASREESRGRLLNTGKTFLLEGWVPAESWSGLEKELSAYPCAYEVSDPAPEDYPNVPVKLKNNPLTKPLNMVTEMYSLPAYGSLDPNPLMAPFFILFYGIMMADMGYGLLMFLVGALLLWKKKPTGTLGHMSGLLVLCGISTFVMGAVTGGFFGDFLPQLLKLINPDSTFALPALFTPLEDTMMILVGAMCLGFVQILTGMAISFYKKLRDGQVMDAIWEEVTWWVVFAGAALAILGVTNLVLILGGVMVVAGPLITGTGLGKITGIFGSLYNHITGYFGDILSYSRLMALMLAGSVIAQVFNTLGAIPGNVVIFIIISLVGNTLNFALNLLGCYVHDLRLQCLEYFGKFYQDGGKPFRPLDLNTKYYNIVK